MPDESWRDLSALLEGKIRDGVYPAGSKIPPQKDLIAEGWNKGTVERVYRDLAERGLVISKARVGTVVRDLTIVPVPLSRYSEVMTPGGELGPWETACAARGLDGRMVTLDVAEIDAPPRISKALGLEAGAKVIRRRRHALIGSEVVQLQSAWYPLDIAQQAGLDRAGKIVGGVLGAMVGAGIQPVSGDERVRARMPTREEAKELGVGLRVPLLLVDHVTRAHDVRGREIELVEIVAIADRVELLYEQLRLKGQT